MKVDSNSFEGSAQRSLQLGVAKKIKNGARKIVLDKAEEARIVAFSAFKSLGYDVLQLAPPIPTTACNSIRKEVGSSSGSDTADTSHSFVDANHIDNSKIVALEKEKDLNKSSENDARASVEDKSDSAMPCSLPTVPVVVPTTNELSMTLGTAKIPDVTTLSGQLQKQNDKSSIHDGCHAHGTGEQNHKENLARGNMNNSSRKGPINAVSTPGGLDSFLDLWDTVPVFYFDIHYIKRLELHSAAPFEVHGIAICWENSPMYYINLPRDILLSNNRKDDGFSLSACSPKHKGSSSNSKQDLMNAMDRWGRISKIIEKKNVKKFTWNLKVQIQVLKKPSVSVQRFGSVDLLDKNMDLEVVDNSYILLPPIHVKEAIDICIVAWILWPDEESSSSPNLDKVT